jgi:hypothetical protein
MNSLRERRVFVYYAFPDFERKAKAIASLLRERGILARACSGASVFRRAQIKSSLDLWIGFWNDFSWEALPSHYIFFNAEPLCVPRWQGNEEWLAAMRGAIEIWDYNRLNQAQLLGLGRPFQHVPFGYAPYYETSYHAHTRGKPLEQDIDVLFVGSLSERRKETLERLRARGMRVHAVTRSHPAHGAKLDKLLAQSKIVLGVHYFADPRAQIIDLARLDHPLSNRLFVVHERPSAMAAAPQLERHITTCSYDDIPDTCAEFVAKPAERRRLADAAYGWFREEYPLARFLPYERTVELLRGLS